ncbi:ABC transporter ATP-binding protein [Levilactobacillus enshiensis]|uniref:ABC transporter ATP-binding protein n=1 Tax=Levilactobacillus enshiensis TaxID=2590213 RepID=UPI00117AFD7E|nr:ABC transporter ATP-binding protein [Levilactobacillus enshiensis]
MAILELQRVTKQFGDQRVLKGLDLTVPTGSIFGFVGENGAGKTTTMKLILGLDTLDSGQITVAGQPVRYGQTVTNQVVGYLPDVPAYYGYMTPTEYLTLCGRLTGMHQPDLAQRITQMLKTVDLPQNRHRIHGFSRGMKQRLGIAQALLNRPQLLICDEPTSALDPNGRSEFLDLLASLRGEMTILFSTHILTDVERISDQVGILHDGVLQVQGDLAALKRQYAQSQVQLKFASPTIAKQAVAAIARPAVQTGVHVTVPFQDDYGTMVEATLRALLAANVVPLAVDRQETSLEDIFREVTACRQQ